MAIEEVELGRLSSEFNLMHRSSRKGWGVARFFSTGIQCKIQIGGVAKYPSRATQVTRNAERFFACDGGGGSKRKLPTTIMIMIQTAYLHLALKQKPLKHRIIAQFPAFSHCSKKRGDQI